MRAFTAPLEEINAYKEAVDDIKKQKFPLHVSGCIDTQKCHMIYGLSQSENWRVIIAENEIRAREIYDDYRLFDKSVMYYPPKDIIFFGADIQGNAISTERLKVVDALLKNEKGTVITTIDAGLDCIMDSQTSKNVRFVINEADIVNLEEVEKKLVDMGYERQTQVENPGDFSVRGGITDIFPITMDCPVRIEFFDDEVDTIRAFDVQSQRSIERMDRVEITPASEITLSEEQLKKALSKIEKEYKKMLETFRKNKNHDAINRLTDTVDLIKVNFDMYHGRMGLEGFTKYFDIPTSSFFDIFDVEKTIFFVDEPVRCIEKIEAVESEFRESMQG